MNRLLTLFSLLLIATSVFGQAGVIKGKVTNSINKEPIPYAVIVVEGTTIGGTSYDNGDYAITGLNPGIYNLKVSFIGYKPITIYEVQVRNVNATFINIEMEEMSLEMQEAIVTAQPFIRKEESPLSIRNIGVAEIKRNPGGNRDISKVIQSLPGVAITSSFRNDIIVRGGSPNENRFYLDGIEVPTINHFSTQGASGGPVGLINVDFIQELDFYSGAFPANRGNALSSILEFQYKDARTDKPAYSITLGSNDLAATIETPLTKNSTLIASYRRSYLQFLFQALDLPFLPKYDDFQFKSEIKVDQNNIIDIIGLGAIDNISLNTDASPTEENQYVLSQIPTNRQWNYTIGGSWRHFKEKSYSTFVLSRNYLNNAATKYIDNDESIEANKLLDYQSTEVENKIRIEETLRTNGWKVNYGAGAEWAEYTTTTFQKLANELTLNYSSEIGVFKYGAFGQVSKGILAERLQLSVGLRLDGNDFNEQMANPLNQLSPRLSASYSMNKKMAVNFNTGIYHQLPPYTTLGYRDTAGELVNTELTYIQSNHLVLGVEYNTSKNARITVEGFYKLYSNYPMDLIDSISLANKGSDFGVIGNAPVTSTNKGRSYGVEFFFQQKLFHNFYGLFSYTFVRSEFQNFEGTYVASSWDYRHMLSITGGKIFKRNWEVGAKFRFNSGSPYTPYDLQASALKTNYDVTNAGVPDNALLNTLRLEPFYQLDVRVDKKYNFAKWTLDVFLDIQNITNNTTDERADFSVERDVNGEPISNPANPNYYIPRFIDNTAGTIIPGIGIVVEF
ncbi:MAG: TonB-dependent receptor [Saprospiraceae bacterium]|nr:TonB-dependent receptor [Saprospiraceae bacterium]